MQGSFLRKILLKILLLFTKSENDSPDLIFINIFMNAFLSVIFLTDIAAIDILSIVFNFDFIHNDKLLENPHKLIFNNYIEFLEFNTNIENMYVYTYEYVNKEKNTMLIREIEV